MTSSEKKITQLIVDYIELPKEEVTSRTGTEIWYGLAEELECVRLQHEISTKSLSVKVDGLLDEFGCPMAHYGFYLEELRFHKSFDWLSLVTVKLAKETLITVPESQYWLLLTKLSNLLLESNISEAFTIVGALLLIKKEVSDDN